MFNSRRGPFFLLFAFCWMREAGGSGSEGKREEDEVRGKGVEARGWKEAREWKEVEVKKERGRERVRLVFFFLRRQGSPSVSNCSPVLSLSSRTGHLPRKFNLFFTSRCLITIEKRAIGGDSRVNESLGKWREKKRRKKTTLARVLFLPFHYLPRRLPLETSPNRSLPPLRFQQKAKKGAAPGIEPGASPMFMFYRQYGGGKEFFLLLNPSTQLFPKGESYH